MWITDPRAAAFLSEPDHWPLLQPFLAKDNTVAAGAQELAMPVNSLLYRIRQMLRLGLLHVTRTQQRAGRAVKHYRTVADSFFVPFSATPFETLEALQLRHGLQAERALAQAIARFRLSQDRAGAWGQRIYRTDRDVLGVTVTQEGSPDGGMEAPLIVSPLNQWETVHLSHEAAVDLKRLLERVLTEAHEQAQPEGQGYMLRVGLVPLLDR